jgi:hypothetical protein
MACLSIVHCGIYIVFACLRTEWPLYCSAFLYIDLFTVRLFHSNRCCISRMRILRRAKVQYNDRLHLAYLKAIKDVIGDWRTACVLLKSLFYFVFATLVELWKSFLFTSNAYYMPDKWINSWNLGTWQLLAHAIWKCSLIKVYRKMC